MKINFASSAVGGLRVELQTPDGQPINGFALADCTEIIGDRIEQIVRWGSGPDVGALAGQPVKLRFVLKDADLFSLQFTTEK